MISHHSLSLLTPEATISQITSANKKSAALLASIGLQPSNHANEALRSVCQQRKWNEIEVLEWAKKHTEIRYGQTENNKREVGPGGDAGLKKRIAFLKRNYIDPNTELINEIRNSLPRVHQIYGNQYLWLKNVQWYFDKFEHAIRMYYEFEQKKFLPLVERLDNSKRLSIIHGTIQKLQKSFDIIVKDQQRLQRLIQMVRNKGREFENSGGSCLILRIQNKNFKTLFTNLDKQFKVEVDNIIPRI